MRKTLTIGPLSIIFANENTELKIPLHHHYAQVRLSYAFAGTAGFPVLAHTIDAVQEKLEQLVEQPFMNTRNERILEIIYEAFRDWQCPGIASYNPAWQLVAVELTVLGTRDRLGHAEGSATYRLDAS
jgi:hypothetical protein